MWGQGFFHASALRAAARPAAPVRLPRQQQQHQQQRHLCLGAAQSAAGPLLQTLAKVGARWGGSAVLLAGAAYALAQNGRVTESDERLGELSDGPSWVRELAGGEGVEEVLSPGQHLRKHPIGKWVSEDDHLFDTMVQSGQIRGLRCFFDARQRMFYSVIELGREVCGFPQTVHGGLTAALIDETVGGLAIALWRAGQLGFRPPPYTARLEVDYKQKIPNGSIILVTTEVEEVNGRKAWMKAKVTNGKGTLYATGRALFVAPRWLPDWISSLTGRDSRSGSRSSSPK